nr:FliA/WhiG family RNA polymerase sigma factor [uncultured Butyricicoccus sp.]
MAEWEQMSAEELVKEYRKTGSLAIKQEIVLRYIHIVRGIALQMRGVYLNFAQVDDIISEGVIALMNAVDKFDPSKNVKFETYISKRIRGLVIDLARRQDWVSRSVRRSLRDIDQAANSLFIELGRTPTDQEVADRLGMSLEKYQQMLGKTGLCNVLSLETMLEESTQGTMSDFLLCAQAENQPEQHLQEEELKQALRDGIHSLLENERMVISLYYEKELNMKEIAQVLKVSEPRISQIHANAIRKLRIYMERFNRDA